MLSPRANRCMRLLILALALLMTAACGQGTGSTQPSAVPSPTTTTPSCTPTPSPTASPTPTEIPTPTPKPTPAPPSGVPPAPLAQGKVVLVSLGHQWLYAYQDGHYVFDNAVETGMPELPTPAGHYSILTKERDVTFISPWPEGSPFWYAPTKVSYAMLFRDGAETCPINCRTAAGRPARMAAWACRSPTRNACMSGCSSARRSSS